MPIKNLTWPLSIACVLSVALLIWSQVTVFQQDAKLEEEARKTQNIIAQLEFWKQLALTQGTVDIDYLQSLAAVDSVTAHPAQSGMNSYTVILRGDMIDQETYQRYSSDLLLTNYFYATADETGLIKDFFWDKP